MRVRAILILATMLLAGMLLSEVASASAKISYKSIGGTSGNDNLKGSAGQNVIHGKGGGDSIDGKESRDWQQLVVAIVAVDLQSPDADGDGVPDAQDQCPYDAGPPPSGCP
jgi:Ca2+-binding RTX toxin-like protein